MNETPRGRQALIAVDRMSASPPRPVQRAQRPAALVAERDRQPREEAEVVGQARNQRMPVVQMEMDRLAQPANRADDLAHVAHGGADGVLDVRHQAGQPGVRRAEITYGQAGMAFGEPGACLPDADVTHVDADAHVRGVLETLRHLGETARFQARRVLDEQRDVGRLLAQEGIQFPHGRQPLVGQFPHGTAIVDDQAGDPPGETPGEIPDYRPPLLLQQADAAIQVHDRQARLGRGEPQHAPRADPACPRTPRRTRPSGRTGAGPAEAGRRPRTRAAGTGREPGLRARWAGRVRPVQTACGTPLPRGSGRAGAPP